MVEVEERIVGAVWVRIMDDYGHIDAETPSFAMAMLEEYRHLGIGTALMRAMLQLLKDKGYRPGILICTESKLCGEYVSKNRF